MYEIILPYPPNYSEKNTSNTHPTQSSPTHGTSIQPAESPLNIEDVGTGLGPSVEIPILPLSNSKPLPLSHSILHHAYRS